MLEITFVLDTLYTIGNITYSATKVIHHNNKVHYYIHF